jgi:hypothetical protein
MMRAKSSIGLAAAKRFAHEGAARVCDLNSTPRSGTNESAS